MLAEEILAKIAEEFDEVEVYVEQSKTEEFELKNSKEFSKGLNSKSGVGVRVVKDGKLAFGWFSNTDEIDDVVGELKNSISVSKEVDADIIPRSGDLFIEQDKKPFDLEEHKAKTILEDIAAKVKGFDRRVVETKSAGLSISYKSFEIANSHGLKRKGAVSSASVSCEVLAEDKIADLGYFYLDADSLDSIDIDYLAKKAASDAVNKLYPKKLDTKKYSVVVENSVFAQMLAHFWESFSAKSVLNHTTPFEDKIGSAVFSDCITIVDAVKYNSRPWSLPFDYEGNKRSDTVVVENGVLKTFLHNTYTASKLKEKNTANAKRGGFASAVEVGPFNFYIKPSDINRDRLLAMVDGLYITEVMGLHMANTISGDFSLGISGFLVHNGELVSYFKSATFADNFYEMIKRIIAVSDNLYFAGSIGSVDVAIADCVIGGSDG